jgi:hypothetical protein
MEEAHQTRQGTRKEERLSFRVSSCVSRAVPRSPLRSRLTGIRGSRLDYENWMTRPKRPEKRKPPSTRKDAKRAPPFSVLSRVSRAIRLRSRTAGSTAAPRRCPARPGPSGEAAARRRAVAPYRAASLCWVGPDRRAGRKFVHQPAPSHGAWADRSLCRRPTHLTRPDSAKRRASPPLCRQALSARDSSVCTTISQDSSRHCAGDGRRSPAAISHPSSWPQFPSSEQ